jgi:signal transduction histidine kinase
MIADGDMSQPDILESAGVIRQQAERMTNLIRKLLDFARRSPQEMRPENLAHSAEQVTHMLSPLAAERKVTIVNEGDSEIPTVQINVAQIQQVLSNLIVNAIHAMPDGGCIKVRCGVRQVQPPADHGGPAGNYAFVEVTDEGIGIPEENLSRIFTPFFSTKQVGEGTGLGLSVAHGIIKEHGGWITVKSTVGEGSTFSIFLPLGGN